MSCIFCKILNKEIPGHIVYEDEQVLAFLDITQATKGHTLLIPKKHAHDITALDENAAQHFFGVIPKLSQAIKTAFQADGINLLSNNGERAGQTIFHFHMHIIPRYLDDDLVPFGFVNHMQTLTQEYYVQRKNVIIQTLKTL